MNNIRYSLFELRIYTLIHAENTNVGFKQPKIMIMVTFGVRLSCLPKII